MSKSPLANSTRLIRMLVNKSLPYRQPHDLQIEPNGPMLNVIQVELNSFFKRGVATPATDLRPPCNPGFHLMLEHIQGNLFSNFLDHPRPFRPRSHDTHVPFQYIPELWQFIETRSIAKTSQSESRGDHPSESTAHDRRHDPSASYET